MYCFVPASGVDVDIYRFPTSSSLSFTFYLSLPLVDLNFFQNSGVLHRLFDASFMLSRLCVCYVCRCYKNVLFSSRLVWCWCASVYIYNQKSHSFCIQGRSQLEIKVYCLSYGWHIVFLVRLFIYFLQEFSETWLEFHIMIEFYILISP